jgi:hypothetical protein
MHFIRSFFSYKKKEDIIYRGLGYRSLWDLRKEGAEKIYKWFKLCLNKRNEI